MYPAKFDYYRATSVDEAIALLQEHGDEAKLIAGGHSLLPMMKMRLAQPATLIDLGRCDELRGLMVDRGNGVTIGAMTTYAEIAADAHVRAEFGALADACAIIGDVQVRNRGTIGGNLSHNDPASDLPAVALALDATLTLRGPGGERSVPAEEFLVGLMTTALEPGEILVSVHFPGTVGEPGGPLRYADRRQRGSRPRPTAAGRGAGLRRQRPGGQRGHRGRRRPRHRGPRRR